MCYNVKRNGYTSSTQAWKQTLMFLIKIMHNKSNSCSEIWSDTSDAKKVQVVL